MRNSLVLTNSALLRRTSAVAVAAVATLALAGCGDDDTSVAQDPASSDTTSAAPATSAPAAPVESPSTTTPSATATVDPNALITLAAPAEGATVSGSFQAEGTANSPEANVPWRILDATGTPAQEGYFTAEGWMDKLYPYAGTVDVSKLSPGDYTFEVRIDDPSGGEGKAPEKVSRSITVQ